MPRYRYRTHDCDALREKHIGKKVRLSGWCHRIRDHGGVLFIDLRDHYGITQVVADPDSPAFKTAETLRSEWVLQIDGKVRKRPAGTENRELHTGAIEVYCSDIKVLSPADELPMPVFPEQEYPEEIRLKYRFLDLRRERPHRNIMMRGAVIDSIRRHMKKRGFLEFQTPILTASSPEGARDYLVPSRLHPGKFYALPQAPQQFKQLIMIAGFDRYFQIAPCFRDEDARADRSPGEFYQLDLEMSFVTQQDVFAVVEPVMRGVFEEIQKKEERERGKPRKPVTQKFLQIPYNEAMLKYGTDKPDLRIDKRLDIVDVTDIFSRDDVSFNAFKNLIRAGGVVRAIPAPLATDRPRSFFDKLNDWAREEGAPGLGYIIYNPLMAADSSLPDEARAMLNLGLVHNGRTAHPVGPIAKFLSPGALHDIAKRAGINPGDAVFFSAGPKEKAAAFAGKVRLRLAPELDQIDENRFEFCWIVDFPMYEWNEEEKRIDFSHNPFSMPNMAVEDFLALDPADRETILSIKAIQYDIVCNGIELSSGAIRNHRPDVMRKAFAIAGYGENTLEQKFGGMLRALSLGAPPHGGIAPGIDRIVMLLCGEENLREVVLFPMNQRAEDLMMGAPSEVTPKQLRELHIRLALPEKSG